MVFENKKTTTKTSFFYPITVDFTWLQLIGKMGSFTQGKVARGKGIGKFGVFFTLEDSRKIYPRENRK